MQKGKWLNWWSFNWSEFCDYHEPIYLLAVQFKTNRINQVIVLHNFATKKGNLQEVTKHKSILSFIVKNGGTKGRTTLVYMYAQAKLKGMTQNYSFLHWKDIFVKGERKTSKNKTPISWFVTPVAVCNSISDQMVNSVPSFPMLI